MPPIAFDTLREAERYGRFLYLLGEIDRIDLHPTPNYDRRERLVFEATVLAKECGFAAGLRIDPKEPDWPVVFIELPTGQVSWHMPAHKVEWDGHTNEEKHRRIRVLIDRQNEDDDEEG